MVINLWLSLSLLSCFYLAGCFGVTSSTRGANATPTGSPNVGTSPAANEKSTPNVAAQGTSEASRIFDPVLAELREKTGVPLRLPTYLATEEETSPLYAIIETATVRHYDLQLAFTKTCTGGTACRYGFVSGQALEGTTERKKGQPVSLAHGINGYFVDAKCGANCSDSRLTWIQDGYRYTVGIKAENMETLIKVANSAIESEPR